MALLSTVSRSNCNLEKLVFVHVEGGKPEYPEKNPRSWDKNQQQTQPTYGTESGNRTKPHWWEANAQPLRHPCSLQNSKQMQATGAKRGKTRASEARLVLVLLLIGWESGANFGNQSQSAVNQNHSNTQLTTALLQHQSEIKSTIILDPPYCKKDGDGYIYPQFIAYENLKKKKKRKCCKYTQLIRYFCFGP